MKRFAWILTLGAFCLGCNMLDNGGHSLVCNGLRTLVVEPSQYCGFDDEHKTHAHHQKLGRAAWAEFCKANPGQQFSDDFASGFAEGYADYLDAGGTTAPPALPPRSYWANRDCRQAAVDWLDGFHAGAQLARSTGLRQVIVVPTVSAINCGAVPVYNACCAPMNSPAPNSPFVPETVPAPAPPSPRNEPPAVPAPSSLPAAPAPPGQTSLVPESMPVAPMPPQTSAAIAAAAPVVPMVPPAYPPASDEVRVEIYPAGACLFNDNGPAYPENVNPLSTHEITGCSHESR